MDITPIIMLICFSAVCMVLSIALSIYHRFKYGSFAATSSVVISVLVFITTISIVLEQTSKKEAAAKNLEITDPCVAWGPTQVRWILVGKLMTPMSFKPCVKRQHEVTK